jgi:cell division protein FtsL
MDWRGRGWVRAIVPYFVIIIMVGSIALFYAWKHVKTLSLGFEINELKQQKKQLEHERRLLLLEKASLVDYENIESRAKQKLGFREPEVGQEIIFQSDTGDMVMLVPKTGPNDKARLKLPH